MDGRVVVRAGMYAVSARVAYEQWRWQWLLMPGGMVERNLLHAGSRAPPALPPRWGPTQACHPSGARECRGPCRCTIEYMMEPPSVQAAPRCLDVPQRTCTLAVSPPVESRGGDDEGKLGTMV